MQTNFAIQQNLGKPYGDLIIVVFYRVVTPVRVVKVVRPEQQKPLKSPVKVPVITLSPIRKSSPSPTKSPPALLPPPPPLIPINSQTAVKEEAKTTPNTNLDAPQLQPNGPSLTESPSSPESKLKSQKLTPKTPSTPLTPEASLNPADYKYVVEMVQKPEIKIQVFAKQLR